MNGWRPIKREDREAYLAMTAAFYASDVVIRPIPPSHAEVTFEELMRSDAYAQAFICEVGEQIAGYALLAKTFSQEAGGIVLWIEELFIKDGCRDKGLGRAFFDMLLSSLPADVKRVRLEVERDNARAMKLYRSFGFDLLEYDQMVLER